MAENVPFWTEHFRNFLTSAARTMHTAGTIFVPALLRRKLHPWLNANSITVKAMDVMFPAHIPKDAIPDITT